MTTFSTEYSEWLHDLSSRFRAGQVRAALAVNAELVSFYWTLGQDIVRLEPTQPWGSRFMQRLGGDLRREIPDVGCFSRVNLYYMKWFYELYCRGNHRSPAGEQIPRPSDSPAIVPQAGEQLTIQSFASSYPNVAKLLLSVPWGHHKAIIDKFKDDRDAALFYILKTVENGWSRSTLEHWISTNLHLREGKAVTNFDKIPAVLPDHDLSADLLKDPYDFSFLPWAERYREKELKAALVDNIEKYLLELGDGFCFKGREIPVAMGSETRAIDMLFYNDIRRFYLVVEVKVRKFEPADVGHINTYMSAVNHQFRKDGDGQTVGLVICREKDRITAQYALEDVNKPIGVAEYTLERFVPEGFRSQLPTIDEIESDQTRRLQILIDSSPSSDS